MKLKNNTVDVLGTKYKITLYAYDEYIDHFNAETSGLCLSDSKEIVVVDRSTCDGWMDMPVKFADDSTKRVIRHELVHAFLAESGLDMESYNFDGAWAINEEMVDWLANQAAKVSKAFYELDLM